MRTTFFLLILLAIFPNSYLFAEANKEDKVELIISDPKKAEGSWGKEADEVEAFQDVKIFDDLSEENTKVRLEEARDFFNSSLAIYKATEKSIKEKKELLAKEKCADYSIVEKTFIKKGHKTPELNILVIDVEGTHRKIITSPEYFRSVYKGKQINACIHKGRIGFDFLTLTNDN